MKTLVDHLPNCVRCPCFNGRGSEYADADYVRPSEISPNQSTAYGRLYGPLNGRRQRPALGGNPRKPFYIAETNEIWTPVRVCPGTLGGREWNGCAYHVKLNMLVTPAPDWCAEFKKDATPPDPEKEHTHGFYFGCETKFDPWSAARGRLTAFD